MSAEALSAVEAPETTGRLLLTGAAGQIGRLLQVGLPPYGWLLRCTDLSVPDGADDNWMVADLADVDALTAVARGCDALVHMGGIATEAGWPDILRVNIDGTHNALEAARRSGVGRVVLASSNHAVGMTLRTSLAGTDVRPRPDTFYGVSKVAMEALGSLYADRYGIDVVCLRIGSQLPRPMRHRHLSTWLSDGDTVRLVQAALSTPAPHFAVVYGLSANTRGWWDHAPGRAIGYVPEDDAETHAEGVGDPQPDEEWIGGEYTTAQFGLDAP